MDWRTSEHTNQGIETWAETIVIARPTGGDDTATNMLLLVSIGAGSIAALGAGIILIRRFVILKV